MTKPLFITFEGGEGSGKTTLIDALHNELTSKGLSVIKTREPGSTPLGEKIREILLHQKYEVPMTPQTELCLFLASRAQHIKEVILPALNNNQIVLCDRFNDSTRVYQGIARGLGLEEVTDFCNFISQNLTPDLTFYLDIDPEIGTKRAKVKNTFDRIESEKIAFHQKIRDAFLALAQKEKRFCVLDASLSIEEVRKEALSKINTFLSL